MNVHLIWGLSALTSLIASITAAYVWVKPKLRMMERHRALLSLVAPHLFFRTIGLSFLVPGVVSPLLPRTFAVPAAHGDFVAAWLAIAAVVALARRKPFAIPLVWIFNTWGALDLLNAIYQGIMGAKIDPGMLGAAFYIPTTIVPPLLVTHALIFWILLRTSKTTQRQAAA